MNELIKTLEKAKAQGRNVIWEDGYEEVTVCIQEEYSESSTILNIDTKSLELPSETEFVWNI